MAHLKETVRGLFLIVDHKVFAFTPMLVKTQHVLLSLRVECALSCFEAGLFVFTSALLLLATHN